MTNFGILQEEMFARIADDGGARRSGRHGDGVAVPVDDERGPSRSQQPRSHHFSTYCIEESLRTQTLGAQPQASSTCSRDDSLPGAVLHALTSRRCNCLFVACRGLPPSPAGSQAMAARVSPGRTTLFDTTARDPASFPCDPSLRWRCHVLGVAAVPQTADARARRQRCLVFASGRNRVHLSVNISISTGLDRHGRTLWAVGVQDEETGTVLAVIPAATAAHATLAAEQIEQLLRCLFAGGGLEWMTPRGTG